DPSRKQERAVGLLRQYQANLTSPEEQALKTSVGKVSDIFGSQLFQALLGKRHTASLGVAERFISRLQPRFITSEFLSK
uniref:Si:dkey-31j3.11 n=1 Tax=Myripristis murdjan TaxID=586833 RepID=A0A667YSQ3_9TELE